MLPFLRVSGPCSTEDGVLKIDEPDLHLHGDQEQNIVAINLLASLPSSPKTSAKEEYAPRLLSLPEVAIAPRTMQQ